MLSPAFFARVLPLCGVLLCALAGRAQFFSDVAPTDADQRAITDAAYHQLMEGFPDGNFYPERPLSRAEGIMVMARLLNISLKGFMVLPAEGDAQEAAVPARHWSLAASRFLAAHGMLDARLVTPFSTTEPVSRGVFLASLYRVVHAGSQVTPRVAAETFRRDGLLPAGWAQELHAPIRRREVARLLDNCLYYLTYNAVTEGTIAHLETDADGNRWARLETDIGECRLAMPPRGIRIEGGSDSDLRVGVKVRTLSDAVAGVKGDKYYRVRELSILDG